MENWEVYCYCIRINPNNSNRHSLRSFCLFLWFWVKNQYILILMHCVSVLMSVIHVYIDIVTLMKYTWIYKCLSFASIYINILILGLVSHTTTSLILKIQLATIWCLEIRTFSKIRNGDNVHENFNGFRWNNEYKIPTVAHTSVRKMAVLPPHISMYCNQN